MHPKIRELADTSQFSRRTVREAADYLPEDDALLDAAIGEAVTRRDIMGFLLLVCAALLRERPVLSRHLPRGLQLVSATAPACCLAWHVTGDDVGERLFEGLRLGGIHQDFHFAILTTILQWSKEHGKELPEGFKMDARMWARREKLSNESVGLAVAIGVESGDERLIDIVLKSNPRQKSREVVIGAGLALAAKLLVLSRKPMMEAIREAPEQTVSGYTVRRSVEHIGRNDPCPCGSGKKYKRCCFEKDQHRLELSTDVAGKTHAELDAELEEHMTLARLGKTQPYALSRIDPEKLDADLLEPFLERLLALEMFEEAVAAFEKLGMREELQKMWQMMTFYASQDERKDLAERLMRVRGEPPENRDDLSPGLELLLVRDDPAAFLKCMDEIAMEALSLNRMASVSDLAFGLMFSPLRSVGILLSRGVLPVCPKEEAVTILDQILIARDKLDLSPDEPFSDVLDRRFAEEEVAGGGKDTEALCLARQKLEAKAGEVRQMKHALEQLKGELERREKASPAKKLADVSAPPAAPVDEKALKELRDKLGALKTDLKERHAERAELRRELSKTLSDLESLRETAAKTAMPESPVAAADAEDRLLLPGDVDGNQPMRVIEFPKKFQQTLEKFPRQVGRGAMSLLGRLAGGEPAAFVGVVRLKDCPETLRARVGIDHRLLFRLQPDCIQVVDLINRRDLEKRIKTL
ncbi:MAG: SEC-C metal-binding domain-containing protein [Luteolibacter sp.]